MNYQYCLLPWFQLLYSIMKNLPQQRTQLSKITLVHWFYKCKWKWLFMFNVSIVIINTW